MITHSRAGGDAVSDGGSALRRKLQTVQHLRSRGFVTSSKAIRVRNLLLKLSPLPYHPKQQNTSSVETKMADLQFPIGKFNFPAPFTADDRQKCLDDVS